MPLRTIIAELSSLTGRSLTTASDRAWLLDRINTAAKELYKSADLYGCFREQLINIGSNDQQITLPYYVEKVLKVRHYEYRIPMAMNDFYPRYKYQEWDTPGFKWRLKQISATHTNITNAGTLTVSVPDTKTAQEPCNVIISGSTENSDRITEILVFNVGDTSKTTVNAFTNVDSIQKNVTTTYNFSVTDIDGNQLALLANTQFSTRYQVVQVLERYQTLSLSRVVEVLYKTIFVPFKNDYDVFPCGDQYDDAIYWKSVELIYAKMDGKSQDALNAHGKCADILMNIANNTEKSIDRDVSFQFNPYYDMFEDQFYLPSRANIAF